MFLREVRPFTLPRNCALISLCLQTILFTLDEAVLSRVSRHDPVYQGDHAISQQSEDFYSPAREYQEVVRPTTPNEHPDARPFTAASVSRKAVNRSSSCSGEVLSAKVSCSKPVSYTGSQVEVILANNWGDSSYMGLTGICLLTGSRQPVAIRPNQLTFSFRLKDGSVMEEKIPELTDGVNLTNDSTHMCVWPIPPPPCTPSLMFRLDAPTSLGGLRVWNYNQGLEESYFGVSTKVKTMLSWGLFYYPHSLHPLSTVYSLVEAHLQQTPVSFCSQPFIPQGPEIDTCLL